MIASFLPPPALSAAMVSSAAVPALLWLLGSGPRVFRAPGPRFRAAVLSALLLLLLWLLLIALTSGTVDLIDTLAAVAIVGEASILSFIAWSLLAWGFTLNMLLVLAAETRAMSLTDWVAGFTRGADIGRLTTDRISVLLGAGFVEAAGAQGYVLTPRGGIATKLVQLVRSTFGIGIASWKSRA
jgi:hypothetical protein